MLVIDETFDIWIRPNNPNDYHLYFGDWWQKHIESNQLPSRKDWKGRCLVIVRSGREKGDIILSVTSDGLQGSSIVIGSVE